MTVFWWNMINEIYRINHFNLTYSHKQPSCKMAPKSEKSKNLPNFVKTHRKRLILVSKPIFLYSTMYYKVKENILEDHNSVILQYGRQNRRKTKFSCLTATRYLEWGKKFFLRFWFTIMHSDKFDTGENFIIKCHPPFKMAAKSVK